MKNVATRLGIDVDVNLSLLEGCDGSKIWKTEGNVEGDYLLLSNISKQAMIDLSTDFLNQSEALYKYFS